VLFFSFFSESRSRDSVAIQFTSVSDPLTGLLLRRWSCSWSRNGAARHGGLLGGGMLFLRWNFTPLPSSSPHGRTTSLLDFACDLLDASQPLDDLLRPYHTEVWCGACVRSHAFNLWSHRMTPVLNYSTN
jgi:hypothetical protein